MKAAKTNNMDLPKGGRRITYVLDPSPITWSKSNLEMGKKLEKTSSLEKASPTTTTHLNMDMAWTLCRATNIYYL
jgi:hypothetical protein